MRELKFRMWSESEQKYTPFNLAESKGKLLVIDTWYPEFCVEQYTGLKDKNGKEIYEGDIIAYIKYSKSNPYIEKGEVMFGLMRDGEGYCHDMFQTYGVISSIDIDEDREILWGETLIDVAEKGVIIGNVHENPGLLGDEQ